MSANAGEPAKRRTSGRAKKRASVPQASAAVEPRAHEPSVEPSVEPSRDKRDVVWTLHLRGVPKTQIAREVDLHRDTVSKLINECYREFGPERRARLGRKLDAAVARIRAVQQRAWADHDADDERERAVLEAAVPGTRYQSQRASYLRLALDAEKEIARLEGLYAEEATELTAVLFSVERVVVGVITKTARTPRIVEEASDA